MTFQTIDQFKASAEFFPRGHIIPQRILKGRRKYKHLCTFGGDAWALPTPGGYMIAVDVAGGGYAIRVRSTGRAIYGMKPTSLKFHGSPYVPGGGSHFVGNLGGFVGSPGGNDEWLKCLNELHTRLNAASKGSAE